MKLTKFFIAAAFAITFFASCTPESINDGQTEQQIVAPKPLNAG